MLTSNNIATVVLMHICGVPKFSCGHDVLAVFNARTTLLTEVHARTKDHKNISCCEYWPRLFCSNTLIIEIEMKHGEEAKQTLRERFSHSLIFNCEKWAVTPETANLLEQIILSKQQKTQGTSASFCMAGRKVSSILHLSGYNCIDYIEDVLKAANINVAGQSMELNELETYIPNLTSPSQAPRALKME